MTPPSGNLVALVDDMLQDAGCGDEPELRDALLSLGALASLPAPAPSGELAALLAPSGTPGAEGTVEHPPAAEQPDDDLARRRRRRHRPTALGLVLVAGMGLGVGGVAASSTAPGSETVQQLLAEWTPPWSAPSANAPAAGGGYPSPSIAADGDGPGAVLPAAPNAAAHAGSRASRLLEGPAGLTGRGGLRSCAGPARHDEGSGPGACVPGPVRAALSVVPGGAASPVVPGGGTGGKSGSQNDGGASRSADAEPPGAPAAGRADTPAAKTPVAGQDGPGAAAPKTADAPAPVVQAPGQGGGRKPDLPAK